MTKVSVIIPTYNEAKVIGECLESLNKQTLKDVEIIVVDDGSTDNTVDILSEYKIIEQAHKGAGAARNLGAKHARGEILVFVDADMTFDPNFLRKLIEPIEHKATKGTFSKEEYVTNWENVWARCWNINNNLPSKRRLPASYPDTQKVFRAILKSEFEKVGGFDEKAGYTDDWTLSEKLGYEAINAEGAIFYHRNPDNLSEVFNQAKWVAKRQYKYGLVGFVAALLRTSLPISILIGLYKSIKFSILQFFIFKVVYDFGAFLGLLDYWLTGNSKK